MSNEEKLIKMLKYVSEHNDFYKNRIKEYRISNPLDITQWPVLTRKELQENRYNMFSDGYKTKYFNQQLRRQSSSGSTGMPVNVYWDYTDWYASNMSLWRKRLQWYGISPSSRCAMFTLNTLNAPKNTDAFCYYQESENMLNISFSTIRNDSDYAKIMEVLENFAPEWMYIQPYILKKLLNKYQQEDRRFPVTVRYIECVGEILEDHLQQEANRFCAVPIVNMYGSEEMNGIGYECPHNNMHILSDNAYVEIKNESGICVTGSGEAIITNLNNKAMPLIRYGQGDNIDINPINMKGNCLCGNAIPIISRINGRNFETIKVNDKIEINPLMLLEIMAEVMNEYTNIITSYRYVFCRSQNELFCIIQLDNNKQQWYANIQKAIEGVFERKTLLKSDIFLKVVMSDVEKINNNKQKVLEVIE